MTQQPFLHEVSSGPIEGARPAQGASPAALPCNPRARLLRRRPRHASGFTLIEIMVVVIIIGLLAVVVVQNVIPMIDQAKVSKAKSDIQGFESALEEFYVDNGHYPTSEEGLKALVVQPTDSDVHNWHQYIQRLPKDPWGNDYVYQSPGTHGKYDVYTLGADGQVGGEGTNADIGNWNLTDN